LALEKQIDEKIKAEELRKAEEKKIEADRVAKVQEWFDRIHKILIDCVGQSSCFIKEKIEEVTEYEVLMVSMFKERGDEAVLAKSLAISKLTTMLHFAEQGENDRAELAVKTKQLEDLLDADPDKSELHLVELKGATCTVTVRQATPDLVIHESLLEKSEHNRFPDLFDILESEYGVVLGDKERDAIESVATQVIELENVIVPRAEYERLLLLTTPKPITADMQHMDCVLIKHDGDCVVGCVNEFIRCDEFVSWLPLPNTPMPTEKPNLEDAPDALGR
jgi:hypothetical protein